MSYKPAYMLFLDGEVKAFVGNYDSLADVRYEHSKKIFLLLGGKGCVLHPPPNRTRKEGREKSRLKACSFFIFNADYRWVA